MKKSGMLARQQAYMDRREAEVRHHTQVYTLDMVTAALGRMGFGEKRLRDFDKMLTEVSKDYAKLILEDVAGIKMAEKGAGSRLQCEKFDSETIIANL